MELSRFEKFCEDIEKEKENARNWAWFALVEAVKGEDVSRIQLEASREILDRLEGKAIQKQIISGENGLPVILKIIKDDGEND